MYSLEIPYDADEIKGDFSVSELISRIQQNQRANWLDIHKGSGLYIVYHTNPDLIKFKDHVGSSNAEPEKSEILESKWIGIIEQNKTDIIYIGRGTVRNRVSNLIRFGLGKAINHKGGEWLWQIDGHHNLRIMVSSCPDGKQMAYEKYLLGKFLKEHKDWPLANRNGGNGNEIWMPFIDGVSTDLIIYK